MARQLIQPIAPLDEDEENVTVCIIRLHTVGEAQRKFETRRAVAGENLVRFKELGDEFFQEYPYHRIHSIGYEEQHRSKWDDDLVEPETKVAKEPEDER